MELFPGGTLITATPEEGTQLAMAMARKSIGAIESDPEVRNALRPEYANRPDSLTGAERVVAIEFGTVAAANECWRK